MEIREIAKIINKNLRILVVMTAIGAGVGLVLFYVPRKYIAQGTIFVGRKVQSNVGNVFGYEGYYGGQAAAAYTNAAVALIESIDVRKSALEKLGVGVNDFNLYNYGKAIRVKKAGPQIISVTVKGSNPDEAANLWKAVTGTAIEVNRNLNKMSDPQMSLSKVLEEPVLHKNYFYIWQFVLAGGFLAFTSGVVCLAFKDYMKGK